MLVDIATQQPGFVRNTIDQFLTMMTKIGYSDRIDEQVRNLALEFLMSLADGDPQMVRGSDEFMKNSFELPVYVMLKSIDDDPDWGKDDDDVKKQFFFL